MERRRFSIYWLSNPLLTFRKGHLGLPPPISLSVLHTTALLMENSRSSGCCASSSMLTIHLERLPGFHSVPQCSLHFPASHISRPFAVPATSPPMSSWGWTTATTPFSPAPFSSQASPPSASPASHISHPFAVPATSPPIPSWGWTTATTTFSPAPPPPQSAGPSAPVSSSVTAPISWRSALSGNSLADYNVAQQRFIGHPSVPPPSQLCLANHPWRSLSFPLPPADLLRHQQHLAPFHLPPLPNARGLFLDLNTEVPARPN